MNTCMMMVAAAAVHLGARTRAGRRARGVYLDARRRDPAMTHTSSSEHEPCKKATEQASSLRGAGHGRPVVSGART
jgi:hypothetical protein